MVGLAQIDPAADTRGMDTVLNVFDSPGIIAGLTEMDRSYLQSLYDSRSMRRSPEAQAEDVAGIMIRDRRAETAEPDETDEQP